LHLGRQNDRSSLSQRRRGGADLVKDAVADGEKLPRPRSVEELRTDKEIAAALADDVTIVWVPVLRDAGRPVKRTSRSMPGCSKRSTRRPRLTDSRARRSSPVRPSKKIKQGA